jgi:hypothetical protein
MNINVYNNAVLRNLNAAVAPYANVGVVLFGTWLG